MRKKEPIRLLKPWKMSGPGMAGKRTILFAKRILDKYGALKNYMFDEAALIFLQQMTEDDKKQKTLEERIEFTVKLMLLHQNRNRLSKDVISKKNAIQTNIRNYIKVNLNHILAADRRTYSEFQQHYADNRKLEEFKNRMDKYEKSEQKRVYQLRLSSELFRESVERKQLKHSLNRLLEMNHFRTTFEKHDFLHVIQKGSLEEKRTAYDILKKVILLLTQDNRVQPLSHQERKVQKEKMEILSGSITYLMEQNKRIQKKYQMTVLERKSWNPFITQKFIRFLQKQEHVLLQGKDSVHYYENFVSFIYQEEKKQMRKTMVQADLERNRHTEEIQKLEQKLNQQRALTIGEREQFESLQKQMDKQGRQVARLIEEQLELKKHLNVQGSRLPDMAARQIKSQLHMDRMRYGLE